MAKIKHHAGPVVDTIRGGHHILDATVTEIRIIKRADRSTDADTAVAEYELPTRIDFLSATPPVVGYAQNTSISLCELHVPAGALEAYTSHPQWCKAAYFVDADGNVVDNYARRHATRLKRMQSAVRRDMEAAKKVKISSLGATFHTIQAQTQLAKWDVRGVREESNVITATITVGPLVLRIDIPKDAPLAFWTELTARLEAIDSSLASET